MNILNKAVLTAFASVALLFGSSNASELPGGQRGAISYSETQPDNFDCLGHLGVQLTTAVRVTNADGTEEWENVLCPPGWRAGGNIWRDWSEGATHQGPHAGVDKIYYTHADEFYHFSLERGTEGFGPQWPGNNGPFSTACNRGFVKDPIGERFWNVRREIKVPVCKPAGVTTDDYIDLTGVTMTTTRLKRMGRYLNNEPFFIYTPNAQGNDYSMRGYKAGTTDDSANLTIGLPTSYPFFFVGVRNKTTDPRILVDGNHTNDMVKKTIKSNRVVNDGKTYDTIIVEPDAPKETGTHLWQYDNTYVYCEVTWEDISNTPGHLTYVLWSFDQNGNAITNYQDTNPIGAALIPNGGTAWLLIGAYDQDGNLYANNQMQFPAPNWPMTQAAASRSYAIKSLVKESGVVDAKPLMSAVKNTIKNGEGKEATNVVHVNGNIQQKNGIRYINPFSSNGANDCNNCDK